MADRRFKLVDRNFLLAIALSFVVLTLWTVMTSTERPDSPRYQSEREPSVSSGTNEEQREGANQAQLDPYIADEAIKTKSPELQKTGLRAEVATSLYESTWTTAGAGLLRWDLSGYATNPPLQERVSLATTHISVPLALATPLEGLGFGDLTKAVYDLKEKSERSLLFELARGGVRVRKRFEFEEDTYIVKMTFEIENEGERHVRPTFQVRWPAQRLEGTDYAELSLAAWHDGTLETGLLGPSGGFLGIGGPLEKKEQFLENTHWAGSQFRYFVAAMIPENPRDASARFEPFAGGLFGATDLAFQAVDIPPGQSITRNIKIYIGPKEGKRLSRAGAHLEDAVPKGWFAPLTNFFLWFLDKLHQFIPNYGVAIVVLTILVRVLMAPILAKQMRSMKRMGELSPQMKEIQAKFGDDRQKQSEEMMKLYKKTGFNPLAGCFPMLLQLPVFIGLFYALQGAIELRHAPFVGWITDLSAPETLFVLPGIELPIRVLPLLMGGSMIIQTGLTPNTTMDPAQARMMKWMLPSVFTVMFYQFASGLVLYWLVSNLLGILQQWYTNRSKTTAS